jgi:DNA-directed RNA polymerase alpha subunit
MIDPAIPSRALTTTERRMAGGIDLGARHKVAERLPRELAGEYGGRIAVHIEQGNFDLARRIIDEAEAEEKIRRHNRGRQPTEKEKLRLPVAALNLQMRIINELERQGIRTVEQLLNTPRWKLRSFWQTGKANAEEVLRAVELLGFFIKPTDEENANGDS